MTKLCVVCGKEIEKTTTEKDVMNLFQNCYECNFWHDHIYHRFDENVVRVGGSHYIIAPNEEAGIRGSYGQTYRIRFISGSMKGKEITTTNLWHQGVIPSRFRSIIPDNAEFIPTPKV